MEIREVDENMTLLKQIEAEKDYITHLRREFHRNPELSLKEYKTAERIEAELDKWGISHQRIGATGVYGIIKGSQPGDRVIALRADIDALPITETNLTEYTSQNPGVMHACGHDAHNACLLGAAKVLAANKEHFGGEIRLIFQPAEEVGQCADDFIDAKVLVGAERVFGLHVAPDLDCGIIGVKPGVNNASVDHFAIRFNGKAAHVSTPQRGVDALYIASQFVVAVQAMVTRCTSPIDPVIIGIGKLTAGTGYNIVAGSAQMEGTTRTTSIETRELVRKQVEDTARQIAILYGGTTEVVWTDYASPLINDSRVSLEVAGVIEELWGKDHVINDRALSLGGDNFAEFLLEVPGAYAYVGTRNPEKPATLRAAHNDGFDIDEESLVPGAALYAEYAYRWLKREL
ncbi:MAG: M20 metallopeptidase family protein [Lachnospiraceae bacterium]